MLDTCDRCGVPVPEAPPAGPAHDCGPAPAPGPALAALPAPEPAAPERRSRRRRGLPRGLRLVIRCRTGSRPGLSLLARLAGRRESEVESEAAAPPAPERPTPSPPEDRALGRAELESLAAPEPTEEPFSALAPAEPASEDEAWNVDLFADEPGDGCGELDGPTAWSDLPPETEPEAEPPAAESAPAATSEAVPAAAESEPTATAEEDGAIADGPDPAPSADQSLLLQELLPDPVAPETAAEEDGGLEEEPAAGAAEPASEPDPLEQTLLSAAGPAWDLDAAGPGPSWAWGPVEQPVEQPIEAPRAEPAPPRASGPAGERETSAQPAVRDSSCFEAVQSARSAPFEGGYAWAPEPRRFRLPVATAWLLPAVLPALFAWAAAPLAGALTAAAGLTLGLSPKRPNRTLRHCALALGTAGLALAVATGLLGHVGTFELFMPGLPWTWPAATLAPGALAGLVLAAAAGLALPGRAAARLAAAAGPAAGALALAAAGASPASALLVGGSLTGGALFGVDRLGGWRRAAQRLHLRAWAVAGVAAIAAAIVSVTLGHPPAPAWAALLALAVTSSAAAARASTLPDAERGRTLLLGASALAGGAAALVQAGLAAGSSAAAATALALLSPGALLAERWRQARSWDEHGADPEALRLLSRTVALLLAGAVAALLAFTPGPVEWTTAAATLLLLCAGCACERGLGGGPAFVLASVFLAGGAVGALLLHAGASAAWLPAVLALSLALPLLAGERLPGRTRRADWERPALAVGGACALASLPACVLLPAAGLAGAIAGALAPSPLLGESRRVRAAAPLLGGVVLLAAALAAGAGAWSPALLALTALVAWALGRRRPELLVGASGAALAAGLLALPLAVAGHWRPATVALAGLGLLGLADFASGGRRSRLAAVLAVGGFGGAAGVAAAAVSGPALPFLLLGAAVALQGLDALTVDGRLSRCLRPAATVAWLAGLGACLPQAFAAPVRGTLLLGAATAAVLLLGLLRRQRAPIFAAGLCAAAAAGFACAAAGFQPLAAPFLFLAPAAAWVVAWGVFESVEGRPPNAHLAAGLGLAALGLLWQVHGLGGPAAWRFAVIALGLALVVAGALARHRVPVLAGGLVLGFEGLVAAVELGGLALSHPGPTALALLGSTAALAAGGWALARRAGGSAPLRMACHGHWIRVREEWRRWR